MASTTTSDEKENTQREDSKGLKVTKLNNSSFKCRICFETFNSLQSVTQHAPNCGKSMSCIECHLLFESKRVLDQHVYMMHESLNPYEVKIRKKGPYRGNPIEMIRCVHCKKLFANERSARLWDHLKKEKCEVIPEHEWEKCHECGKKFKSWEGWKKHKKSMICQRKSFPCDKCDILAFETQAELRHHKFIHMPRKAYPCPDCNRSYDYPDSLKRHVNESCRNRKQKLPKAYPCPDCNRSYDTPKKLKRHVDESCQNRKKELPCENETEVDDHINQVPIKNPTLFECSFCEKKCRLKADLTLHIGLIHEGKKRKTCFECGKMYFESDMEEHMQSFHGHNKVVM